MPVVVLYTCDPELEIARGDELKPECEVDASG